MADVSSLNGITFDDGSYFLLSTFGNDVQLNTSGLTSWIGQSQNLVPGTFEGALINNYFYLCNLSNNTRVMNSTMNWSTTTNLLNAPRCKYPFSFRDRAFFGNCLVNGTSYQRRIFYSDIIEKNDGVTWDLEHGTDLIQEANSNKVTSATAVFITSKIRIGDSFIINNGPNVGTYGVYEIVNETTIILDRVTKYFATGSSYIVGSNWFDVDGANTGIGEHYGIMLAFTADKAWRWAPSIGRKQVLGVKGTPSHRSIVSNHRGYTFWYHPTDGIIQYNGSQATVVSGKIQPILDAVTSSMFGSVVGWPGVGKYKDHVYFYIGDVTFYVEGEEISLTKTIVDYNIIRGKWKVFEYNAEIKCATIYKEGSQEEAIYLGTSSSMVLKFNTGNSDYDVANDTGTLDIAFKLRTHPKFFEDPEVELKMEKYFGYLETGTGLNTQYKLHGTPGNDDSGWSEIFQLNKKYDQVEIDPQKSKARGISYQVDEISSNESFEFNGFSQIYSIVGEAYENEL